jgi:hypothetical protein
MGGRRAQQPGIVCLVIEPGRLAWGWSLNRALEPDPGRTNPTVTVIDPTGNQASASVKVTITGLAEDPSAPAAAA